MRVAAAALGPPLALTLGLVAAVTAGPRAIPATRISDAVGLSIAYARRAPSTRVAVIEGLDLADAVSIHLDLESTTPTQLDLFVVLPGGETRRRYLVLAPAALRRSVHLDLADLDPEPSARWDRIPDGGAVLMVDVPGLQRLSPTNRLRLSNLRISREAPPPSPSTAPPALDDLGGRLHAAWIGKALGGRLGMPREGNPEIHPALLKGRSLALDEEAFGFGPDDDSTFGVASLLLTGRLGRLPLPAEIAVEWMTAVSPEFHWKNAWAALARIRRGVPPPRSGEGEFGEFLDARIRADVWGLLFPGDPAAAARAASRDAGITSRGLGVDDARFAAALVAAAFDGPPLGEWVERALAHTGPRYAEAVRRGFVARSRGAPFPEARAALARDLHDPLLEHFGDDTWIHSLPNAGLLGLALAYGEGDPVRTLELAAGLGWDADCNAGTLGMALGAWKGPGVFPAAWTAALGDRLRVAIAGEETWSLRDLAARTREIGAGISPLPTGGVPHEPLTRGHRNGSRVTGGMQ